MWRIALRYGLFASILFIGWGLIENELGINNTRHHIGIYTRPASLLLFILILFIAIRDRKAHQYNVLLLKQGLMTGFFTSLYFTTLSTLWLFVYRAYINTGYYSSLLLYKKSLLAAEGFSEPMLQLKIKELESDFANQSMHLFTFFIVVLAIGLLCSFIFSYRLQTRKEEIIDLLNAKKRGG